MKFELMVSTRKLSKVIDIMASAMNTVSSELKHMDKCNCPECGSEERRVEHDAKFEELKEVRCLECNHLYVMKGNEVDLASRK